MRCRRSLKRRRRTHSWRVGCGGGEGASSHTRCSRSPDSGRRSSPFPSGETTIKPRTVRMPQLSIVSDATSWLGLEVIPNNMRTTSRFIALLTVRMLRASRIMVVNRWIRLSISSTSSSLCSISPQRTITISYTSFTHASKRR